MKIYIGDCLDVLAMMESETIDLFCTDPAYASLVNKWAGIGTTARMGLGKAGTKSANADKLFECISDEQLEYFLRAAYRLTKPNRHAYIMCDPDTLFVLHRLAVDMGIFPPVGYGGQYPAFKPLVWDKMSMGTGYTYRQQYEFVAMLWKGKKKRQLKNLGVSDVLRYKKPGGKDKIFPTQKPLELMELLISQSTKPNEVVCDPFLGSGTTAIAAHNMGCQFIGIEKNPETAKLAIDRISQVVERDRIEVVYATHKGVTWDSSWTVPAIT